MRGQRGLHGFARDRPRESSRKTTLGGTQSGAACSSASVASATSMPAAPRIAAAAHRSSPGGPTTSA